MNTNKLKIANVIMFFAISPIAKPDDCEMNGAIPEKWIIAKDVSIEKIIERDNAICENMTEELKKKGVDNSELPECDWERSDHTISKLYKDGDQIHWFNNYEFCPDGGEKALDGYVLVRNGEQIGFELKTGIHER